MAGTEFDAEAHMDLMAAALGLPIAPEHRAGVITNLARTAELARLVMDFPLPDEVEFDLVFRP
jgi:hypothetical protein